MDEKMLPAGIDIRPMMAIHRHPEEHLILTRKNPNRPNGWENLGATTPAELCTMLPAFASHLTKDAYFTISSFFHPAPERRYGALNLPLAKRQKKLLQRLNACYADLDVGRQGKPEPHGLDVIKARTKAFGMMQLGILPDASYWVYSGRGAYLIWLLHDRNEKDYGTRVFERTKALWVRINKELNKRLKKGALAPDPSVATDPIRVLRVPGTEHGITGGKAKYQVNLDQEGRIISYEIDDLARFLDIPLIETYDPGLIRITKNRGTAPKRLDGYSALHRKRLSDMKKIEVWRGGFRKAGMRYEDGSSSSGRHKALSLYGVFYKGSGASREETREALALSAKQCIPPYPSDKNDPSLQHIIDSIWVGELGRKRWKNQTLCDMLGIAPADAEILELLTIIPDVLTRKRKAEGNKKKTELTARRSHVEWIFEKKNIRTCRSIADALRKLGFYVTPQTVANDLKALGISSNHRGGRPRKDPPTQIEMIKENSIPEEVIKAQEHLMKKRRERQERL